MDAVISLLVLSTLPQLIISQGITVKTRRAAINIEPQESRIFSGESLLLICSVPDDTRTSWNYLWFKGSEKLPHSGRELSLWNTKVRDSGTFYCQGWRDTMVGNIYTMKSLPMEINVDGGFAILQVAPQPSLVGESLRMTCRLRGRAKLHEIILYKDGIELMTQNGYTPQFYLTNLTVEDQGMYSCRASWDVNRRTLSVISVDTHVQILEVLTQPRLEIDDKNMTQLNEMKLICHLQYNARAPAPPIHYYFYRNSKKLGVATSENHHLARQTPGLYNCKARVPEFSLLRWSESKMFGQKSEQQMMTPPRLHSRYQPPVAPRMSSPVHRQPPAAQPAAQLTNATPAVFQTSEKDISPDSLVTGYQTIQTSEAPAVFQTSEKDISPDSLVTSYQTIQTSEAPIVFQTSEKDISPDSLVTGYQTIQTSEAPAVFQTSEKDISPDSLVTGYQTIQTSEAPIVFQTAEKDISPDSLVTSYQTL